MADLEEPTANIVAGHVANSKLGAGELPDLIASVSSAGQRARALEGR